MTAATLDSIDESLFAAVSGLLATAMPAGPFAQATRFVGEGGVAADRRVALAPGSNVPAVMLAFERETFRAETRTNGGDLVVTVGRSTWRLFVVASDLRGDAAAVKGSASTGVFALTSAVTAAVAGLPIAGTYRNRRAELLDAVPAIVRRGEYVWVVRVAVERALESVPETDTSVDLLGIDADVNLTGTADDPPSPFELDQFTADTDASDT